MIDIISPGPLTTVQDLGRPGYAAWGIASAGAADRGGLRLANRLVGNDEDAAAFEVLLGGASFRFGEAALIAVTGAADTLLVDGAAGRCDGPQPVAAGAVVQIPPPTQRVRSYLAVRGGLDTPPLLGSRSVDEHSGLGRPLRPGDVVPIGPSATSGPSADWTPRPSWPAGPIRLTAVLGPREDWLTPDSRSRLGAGPYVVAAESDRVGTRLDGPSLERQIHDELLSEPTVRGAIEVPPNGQPIVFGADHPTTCGYPVVAVLEPDSSDLLAQCRPGQPVIFALVRPRIRLTIASATPTPGSAA
jgi:biotin-dependent carboxylase-like uncharacterized protein